MKNNQWTMLSVSMLAIPPLTLLPFHPPPRKRQSWKEVVKLFFTEEAWVSSSCPWKKATTSEVQRIGYYGYHHCSYRSDCTTPAPETLKVSEWGRTGTEECFLRTTFPPDASLSAWEGKNTFTFGLRRASIPSQPQGLGSSQADQQLYTYCLKTAPHLLWDCWNWKAGGS